MKNNVYAVIVSYNFERNSWIRKCLDSLLSSTIGIKIIVVDNNSEDDTVEIIKKDYPEVLLFEQKENLGFAKANNIGIKYAYEYEATHVFLLNQDAWIDKSTIECLLKASIDNPDYGIISPLHFNGKGDGFDVKFCDYCCTNSLNHLIAQDLYFKNGGVYQVSFVNAAAWLITRNCIEIIGGFNTLVFKHYGEDNNFCHRVLFHGLKIGICTGTNIYHDRQTGNHKVNDEVFLRVDLANINNHFKILRRPLLYTFTKFICNVLKNNKSANEELLAKFRFVKNNRQLLLKSREIDSKNGGGVYYLQ